METLPSVPVSGMPEKIEVSAAWMKEAGMLAVKAHDLTVNDQDDFEQGELVLKKLTRHTNALEKQRKAFVKPLQEMTKAIKKMADDANAPLLECKEAVKAKLMAYQHEQERIAAEERERERERLMEETKKREEEEKQRQEQVEIDPFGEEQEPEAAEPVIMEPEYTAKPVQTLNSSIRTTWTFEIEDEDAVPRIFCSPDSKKIREFVKEHQGNALIQGVKVMEKKTIASR